MSLPDAFAKKVHTDTGCHIWIGAVNTAGYGVTTVNSERHLAHRVAFEAEFGPISDGLVIDHLCRVRNCVNPMHLEGVTTAENNRRGRRSRGLQVEDICNNGHLIESERDLYVRSTGSTECRFCRQSGDHRQIGTGTRRRTSSQRSVEKITTVLEAVRQDGAA